MNSNIDLHVSWLVKVSILFTDIVLFYSESPLIKISVVALYSKTAGNTGKHSAINESSNIAAVSYLAVQVFQHRLGRQFRSVPDATALFQTNQFLLLSSMQFLCLVETVLPPQQSSSSIELLPQGLDRYKDFRNGQKELTTALKLSKRRDNGGD
jgi:hypothetical protein